MSATIPSTEDLRRRLAGFDTRRLRVLAEMSGVPFTSLYNVKQGYSNNPGIEMVRRFFPHIRAAARAVI